MFDLSQFFHTYVIRLKGWEERTQKFIARAEELGVTGFDFIDGADGDLVGKPNWWIPTARKWACNLAHLNALHCGIMAGEKPILILEDDAYLRDNFIESIQETIAYFRDHEDATALYLGGRAHNTGVPVSRLVYRGVRVGGGYAYVLSQSYARVASGFYMDIPRRGARLAAFAQDTKLMSRAYIERHAVIHPVCVGHNGGASILLKKNRRPENL